MKLTVKTLGVLSKGQVLSESLGRGAGTLRAVGVGNGRVTFQLRHTRSDGRRDDLPIGAWSERGADGGLTLAEARQRVRALASRYANGERDLRAAMGLERRAIELAGKAEQQAKESEQARQAATLGALLLAYVESLTGPGKKSARAVQNSLRKHVQLALPNLWMTPVDQIELEDLVNIVHRLVEAGKTREAAKVRSYLRAAFSAAVAARQSPSAPASLRALKVTSNPARDLSTVSESVCPRDRALSVAELRAYWRRIEFGREHAILRFHLLTGGQRIEQLARTTLDDWDTETKTLRVWDWKGKRAVPRAHYVPILPAAFEAMCSMDVGKLGPSIFTVTAGRSGANYSAVRNRLSVISKAMAAAGESGSPEFTAGDVRRTVETRLAALGVSNEIRAHLQSHGLSGVQTKHYNRHDYLVEKHDALLMLFALVKDA